MPRKGFAGAAVPTTLSGAILSTDTTLTIASATGWAFGGNPFVIVVDRGGGAEEKILCASIAGTTVTVAAGGRGYDGTTAFGHAAGATVLHVLDSLTIDEANAHVNTTTRDDHTQYLRTDGTRATTGSQTFGAITVHQGGLDVSGGPVGYGGGEIRFPTATAGADIGFYGMSTGSPDMRFEHRGAGNTGFWRWANGTNAASERMFLDAAGVLTAWGGLRAAGTTQSLGSGAAGGAGGFVQVTTDATANVTVSALHSAADANFLYRTKGGGGHYFQSPTGIDWFSIGADHAYFRKRSDGSNLAIVDGTTGSISSIATDHYLGPNAFGAAGARVHVQSSGSGGNDVILMAESDQATANLNFRSKGAGVFRWQTNLGAALATLDSTGLFVGVGGVDATGSPSGTNGGEFRFPLTGASLTSLISTLSTGAPMMVFDHRATNNTGQWRWDNGTAGVNQRMLLDANGNLSVLTGGAAVNVASTGGYNGVVLSGTNRRVETRGDQSGMAGFDAAGNARFLIGIRSDVTSSVSDLAIYTYSPGRIFFYSGAQLMWGIDNSGNLMSTGGSGGSFPNFTGNGVIALRNASANPFTTPVAGGVLYASAGALHWRGSAGTDTVIAAA